MINVFGDNRITGQKGPKGEDAFDLIQWAPHGIRRLFRESNYVNIYFNTQTDGIIYSKDHKPIGLKNHGLGPDAKFLSKKFPAIKQIKEDHYMIELKDSIFEINPARAATVSPSSAIFLFSCKPLIRSLKGPRFLFSNKSGSRAVSIEEREMKGRYFGVLTIYSSGAKKEIFFKEGQCNGVFVQYICKDGIVYCHYRTADTHGFLETEKEEQDPDHILYIGGHPEKSMANDAMGSFELHVRSEIGEEEETVLSEKMQNCLLKDILDRVDE